MELIVFGVFFGLIALVSALGWVADSRDGADWRPTNNGVRDADPCSKAAAEVALIKMIERERDGRRRQRACAIASGSVASSEVGGAPTSDAKRR